MTKTTSAILGYASQLKRRILLSSFLAVLTLVMFFLDVQIGSSYLSVNDVIKTVLTGPGGDSSASFIIWDLRIPMTLTCVFVGASLGLAGLLIQTITNNPLASPYTLGVTAGASFGAAVSITLGFSIAGQLWVGTSVTALVFALSISFFIFYIGKLRTMSATTLILVGIIMNFFFQALQQYLQYVASPEVAQIIAGWTFGNLQRSSWTSVFVSGICWILCFILIMPKVWKLTALSAGEERAASLGIDISALRLFIFILSSILVASAVGFIGTVAFVGLIAPHCAKLLLGGDQRFLLPCASMFGCLLMLGASVISKLLSEGATLPVGIVTSVIGVPFLFALLLKSRGN